MAVPYSPTNANTSPAALAESSGVSQAEVMEESKRFPDLNPDAIIGNIMSKRSNVAAGKAPAAAPPPTTLSGSMAETQFAKDSAKLEQMKGLNAPPPPSAQAPAPPAPIGMPESEARKYWEAAGNDSTGWQRNQDGSWTPDSSVNLGKKPAVDPNSIEGKLQAASESIQEEYDRNQAKLDALQATADQQNAQLIQSIKDMYAQRKAQMERLNRGLVGSTTQAGIRAGRNVYAAEMEAQLITGAEADGIQRLAALDAEEKSMVLQAEMAKNDKDMERLSKSLELAEKANERKRQALLDLHTIQQDAEKALLARSQEKREQAKFEFDVEQEMNKPGIEADALAQKTLFELYSEYPDADIDPFADSMLTASEKVKKSDSFAKKQQEKYQGAVGEYQFYADQEQRAGRTPMKFLEFVEAKNTASSSPNVPTSYREWELAGKPGTFAEYLTTRGGKPLSADAAKVLSIAQTLPTEALQLKEILSTAGRVQIAAILSGGDAATARLIDSVADKVGRLRSGGAINKDEAASFKSQILRKADLLTGDMTSAIAAIDGLIEEASNVAESMTRGIMPPGMGQNNKIDNTDPDFLLLKEEFPEKTDQEIWDVVMGKASVGSATDNARLGSLSEKYESGGDPGAIGYDSTGGLSYGKYQLAHQNARKFVEQSPYANEFSGLAFNSKAWQDRWKEVARKDPEGFGASQKSYIEKTHYAPQVQRLAKAGFDAARASDVLKEVIWSTAVQHGGGTDVIEKALKKAGKGASEADLIKAIYDERWSGGRRFASSTEAVRNSVRNRFFGKGGEMEAALARLS